VALIAPTLGGKVSYPFQLRGLPSVESVRGADLMEHFEAFVEAKVTTLIPREVKQVTQCRDGGFQLTLDSTDLVSTRSLIICTGAQPQRLYVPGELDFMGHGVSFSAISHAQLFRKRNVAVIGGERALNAVVKLATIANRVYYILARAREMSESPLAEKALEHPNVAIFRDWEVQRIAGDQFVTNLVLVATNGETRSLQVEGVFVELGLLPNNDMVQGLVDVDDAGRVIVNSHCETNIPGLFAAGDVTNVYAEQVPVAIGEGVKAALSAWSYVAMHKGIPHQVSTAMPTTL
jgi:thioredoxin reductase